MAKYKICVEVVGLREAFQDTVEAASQDEADELARQFMSEMVTYEAFEITSEDSDG